MSGMEKWMEEFLELKKIAVVGATDKKEKWGYKILKRLLDEGYEVVPIHPKLKEIEGISCYPSLKEVPDDIEGVDIVVPPSITPKVVQQAIEKGIQYIWLQPGAESEEAIEVAQKSGKEVKLIHHNCVLQALNKRSSS